MDLAKKARELAPADSKVAGVIGGISYQAGNFSWAYSLLHDGVLQSPDDPTILHDLAWTAYSLGRVAEARDTMQHLLTAALDVVVIQDAKTFLAMTEVDDKTKDPATIEPQAAALLKTDPNYVPALMVEASTKTRHSESTAAIGIYTGILDRLPDFAPAQKALATLYAEDPAKSDQAYDLAMKARKALPDDPDVALTLASLCYQRKDYSYTVQLLQESQAKAPLDATNLYYLGMSQVQVKQSAEGRKALTQALAAGLKEPFATEAKQLLAASDKK